MRYMGGKSRISKDISKIINAHATGSFVSLFCGSCSIESKVNSEVKLLNDKQPYLIEMFRGLQRGRELPDNVSEAEYYRIKNNLDEDKVMAGFVGFACSFGGKWFGGYARNNSGRNYTAESKKSVMKDMEGLKNATFISTDYRNVVIPENSVVYADPPYKDTTTYGSKLKFDTEEFWEYIRKISINNIVFVSEEQSPSDFSCIWQKEVTRTLDVNKNNQPKKIEKLFTYNDGKFFDLPF